MQNGQVDRAAEGQDDLRDIHQRRWGGERSCWVLDCEAVAEQGGLVVVHQAAGPLPAQLCTASVGSPRCIDPRGGVQCHYLWLVI